MSVETTQTGGLDSGFWADEGLTGKEKLERLKARLFPPETKDQRVAQARDALRKAIIPCKLDTGTIKYLAQHSDLEGF